MKKLIIVGGGGHAKSCIDVIEQTGQFEIVGIVDPFTKLDNLLGYKIFKTDDVLKENVKVFKNAIVCVGQIKSPDIRIRLYNELKKLGYNLPVIISPLAYVSKYAKVAEGTIVMHRATLNSGVEVGENCIINSHALLEHDAVVGSHCHISTGSIVNGDCVIGKESFVGSRAVLKEGVKVVERAIIPFGAVVK